MTRAQPPLSTGPQINPAFVKVAKAPFLLIVFNARAVNLTVTNRFCSGTQIRLTWRLGKKVRGTTLVTCCPIPPFFLAKPRRWITEPREGLDFVILQTRLITRLSLTNWGGTMRHGRLVVKRFPCTPPKIGTFGTLRKPTHFCSSKAPTDQRR